MLSIVIDLNNLNTKLLNFFVRELRKKNISISITITNKNYDSKLLYGSDYPWCYCGYLNSFVNNNLSHIYDENVKVLKKLPKKTQKTVSNVNAINYLYGGHKYD